MSQNPPESRSRISPYLLYEDAAGALDWLAAAFGFRERLRVPGPDGRVSHAEMELEGGVIMLGEPGNEFQSPKRLGHATQWVHVYVDNVDEHFTRAKEAGATILSEPTDQVYGDRRYDAKDPEGHPWSFAQHIRDVPLEEWQA